MWKLFSWLGAALCCCALVACSGDDSRDPSGGAGTGTTVATGDVPCAVATVLQQHCAKCHGAMLQHGAPLTLLRAADFEAAKGTMTIGMIALARVQDPLRPMPQPPDPRLSDADIATMRQWIDQGAPVDPAGCAVHEPVQPIAGSGGMGGGGAAGSAAGSGVAGAAGSMAAGSTMEGAGSGGSAGTGMTEPTTGWSMFGHDLSNTRDNPDETMISADNVASLHQLWKFDGKATTSTPAVVDGVVYLPTWDGSVHALRAEDGSPVWMAKLPDLIDSSPAVTPTQVIVSDDAGSVHALDRASGVVQWSKRVEMHAEAHLWSSPVYVADANLIVVGVASGEEDAAVTDRTFRGSVVGLDAATGDIKWQYYTTDLDSSSGPGIAVWGTAAIDTGRKLVYIGTGNAYAEPTGKYADSMLAINYETGALAWATQFTAEDVFVVGAGATGPDSDVGSTANLFTAGDKDLVGIGVKNGIFYALDRDSGTITWMQMLTEGGPLGGVISASAYAGDTIYVASNQLLMGSTRIVALDATKGTVRWDHESPMVTYGGVAHANGVTYVGTTDGTLVALKDSDGTELWSEDMPDAIAGSPIVANGMLFVPWGYQWTLRGGTEGTGGMVVYGL